MTTEQPNANDRLTVGQRVRYRDGRHDAVGCVRDAHPIFDIYTFESDERVDGTDAPRLRALSVHRSQLTALRPSRRELLEAALERLDAIDGRLAAIERVVTAEPQPLRSTTPIGGVMLWVPNYDLDLLTKRLRAIVQHSHHGEGPTHAVKALLDACETQLDLRDRT